MHLYLFLISTYATQLSNYGSQQLKMVKNFISYSLWLSAIKEWSKHMFSCRQLAKLLRMTSSVKRNQNKQIICAEKLALLYVHITVHDSRPYKWAAWLYIYILLFIHINWSGPHHRRSTVKFVFLLGCLLVCLICQPPYWYPSRHTTSAWLLLYTPSPSLLSGTILQNQCPPSYFPFYHLLSGFGTIWAPRQPALLLWRPLKMEYPKKTCLRFVITSYNQLFCAIIILCKVLHSI